MRCIGELRPHFSSPSLGSTRFDRAGGQQGSRSLLQLSARTLKPSQEPCGRSQLGCWLPFRYWPPGGPQAWDCSGSRFYPHAPSPTVSAWVPRVRGWQEITGLMFCRLADVHSPLVCSLGVLLVRNLRVYRLVARVRNEFLGSATRVLHALLPLLAGKRGVGKAPELLCETIR
jgi:hypothetical protein